MTLQDVRIISNDPYARGAAEPFLSRPTGVAVAPAVYGVGAGYNGIGNGGVLGYNGILGGYGGVVNFGAPLVGGAIRGYDSRFVRLSQ
ncbi:hypothetical protein AVEN_176948-1 [Araneus ventricosus]|uniref:Uncharacterized protein n=1 Tax=Araneus ventricosus TaxID=182803 RepID=A0A4Y2K9T9_ARAVE|nr:hypothetical protein AVEN_176948-1 [Araneus ventricosus]